MVGVNVGCGVGIVGTTVGGKVEVNVGVAGTGVGGNVGATKQPIFQTWLV